ncbi:hypothetical protein ACKWTF_015161 [Chironomus riparius]
MSSLCNGTLAKLKDFHMNSIPAGLGMNRNSILWPIFDEVMNKLIPSGILQYLLDAAHSSLKNKFEIMSANEARILTFEDLKFGFILWIIACGVSTAGFIFEHAKYFFIHRIISSLKDFAGLVFVLHLVDKGMQ